MSTSSSVKTIDRLVQVLDCFSPEEPTWSLAELSLYLELPKSTLHRFLTGLQIHGILRRNPDDKRWQLGYRLVTWGELSSASTDLGRVARPIMRDLVATTGETAVLTVCENQQVVCIEKVETSHSVRLTLDVGIRRPLHAGASSKILMAYLPKEEIRTIIRDQGLPAICTNTITDSEALMAELARIRERGYAASIEETDIGAWGVATPIYDRNGNVLAAIGIVGPSSRFSAELPQQYVTLCHIAAKKISTLLGGE